MLSGPWRTKIDEKDEYLGTIHTSMQATASGAVGAVGADGADGADGAVGVNLAFCR